MIAGRLRKPLMPWQRHVADVALELDDDGSLFYDEVNLLVGRQEGKTELKFVLMVMRMTVMAATGGPQRVTYTMQNRKKARTRLERDYAPRLRKAAGFREVPAASRKRPTKQTEWRLGMNSGVEAIQFGAGSFIQIDTPSRTDGHGDSIDAGFIDEAFAHEDNTVELGMEPAMLTRPSAQLWVLSASGDVRSKYLYGKVVRGRKLVDTDATVAYFEWSAEYGVDDPADPATWARACPALGFTITEEKLRGLYVKALEDGRKETLDGYCRAYLCMWPEVPVLEVATDHRIIPADAWARRGDGVLPVTPAGWSTDVAPDGASSAIGCSDGVAVDLVEHGVGTRWVLPRMVELRGAHGFNVVHIAANAPVGALKDGLEAEGFEVVEVSTGDHADACEALLTAVVEDGGEFHHANRPPLDAAVAGAGRRNYGDSWLWSRRSSTGDICPLVAVTLAWRAAKNVASMYEDRGMTVL